MLAEDMQGSSSESSAVSANSQTNAKHSVGRREISHRPASVNTPLNQAELATSPCQSCTTLFVAFSLNECAGKPAVLPEGHSHGNSHRSCSDLVVS